MRTQTNINTIVTKSEGIFHDKNQNDSSSRAEFCPSFGSSLVNSSLIGTNAGQHFDVESSDDLAEIVENGKGFNLHRLLSDFNGSDFNIDMDDGVKFDLNKIFENRSLSEFDVDIFDQINPLINDSYTQSDSSVNMNTGAISLDSDELHSLAAGSLNDATFTVDETQLRIECSPEAVYTELNSFEPSIPTPQPDESVITHFNFNPAAIAIFEHDYSSLMNPVVDTPTSSPTITTVSKRAPRRTSTRMSSRLQSRAKLISFDEILNENSCSPSMSETSSTSSRRPRTAHLVQRLTDINNEEERSSYLERRRKNNEASKISRAARKHRFDEMDSKCTIYERTNAELKEKISTLETVTAALKNGLINSFQRTLPTDRTF